MARIDGQRRVLDAICELKEPYRSTMFHCHIEGLAPEAVARRLGVPTRTVVVRLQRALRLVAERMGAP